MAIWVLRGPKEGQGGHGGLRGQILAILYLVRYSTHEISTRLEYTEAIERGVSHWPNAGMKTQVQIMCICANIHRSR